LCPSLCPLALLAVFTLLSSYCLRLGDLQRSCLAIDWVQVAGTLRKSTLDVKPRTTCCKVCKVANTSTVSVCLSGIRTLGSVREQETGKSYSPPGHLSR